MSRARSTPLPSLPIRDAGVHPDHAGAAQQAPTTEQVFDYAKTIFARAAAASAVSVVFHLAGYVIRINFAGDALPPLLTPAFAHLAPAQDLPADLTVCCWDDASSGEAMVEPDRSARHGGIDFTDGPVRIAWEPEQRGFSAFSIAQRLALMRVPDAQTLPSWERAAPLRRILHWWAAARGLQLVHAAALGDRSGGVLLVGRGGSGKSTTALACIGSPIGYAGDDYCLISIDTEPRVHALYSSGKADPAAVARLPQLAAAFAASTLQSEGKSVIFLAADAMINSFSLRAIVVPRIEPYGGCRLDQLSRAEALRALAPSTLFQMPGDRRDSLARLTHLIRQLPCWQLTVGPNPADAQALLKGLFATGQTPA